METVTNGMRTPTKDIKSDSRKSLEDTTTKRRVSDILVSLHKCIQEWYANNQLSFETANTLCSLYGQWDNINDGAAESEVIDMCKLQYNAKLHHTREDLILQLKKHKERLEVLYSKMSELVVNLKAIYYMGLSAGNKEFEIFNNWSVEKFYSTSRRILNMFSKEYMLKITLYCKFLEYRVENDESGSEVAMLNKYVSIWLHQPFLDSGNSKLLLDAMLIEAELK